MSNPMPVSVHGFSVTAGMVALLNVIIVTAIGGLIKAWPKLKELGNSRRKDELDALRERVSELETQIQTLLVHNEKADERAHQAELKYEREMAKAETKLSRAATAVQLVIGELEKAPDGKTNPVIKQARDLIAMAATGDYGFRGYIEQLGQVSEAPK